jgi:DnaJ like chaperone protein
MGILGKIVGGTLGFAIGGPIGAIAGAAFGHVFDKSNGLYDDPMSPRLGAGESTQLTFYVAAFSMLAKLVQTDGRMRQEELDAVEHFMVHDLNLDAYGQSVTRNIFHAAMKSSQGFEDFARQFYFEFKNQPQLLELMIDILVRVSTSDSRLNESEERLIRAAVGIFNFSIRDYEKIKQKYAATFDKSYAVLGCDRNDSDEQIKSRYRKLVNDFHPDKIASKGLPEEFTRFATEKFQEIQAAYEDIQQERRLKAEG